MNKEIYFQFKHQATDALNKGLLIDGASDNALSIIIRVEWSNADGVVSQEFIYNDTMVGKVVGANDYTFRLTGYDTIGLSDLSTLNIYAMIVTDSGATAYGEVWTASMAN